MLKILVGIVVGVVLTFPTTKQVMKMEWNHIKNVSSFVVESMR
jgi:hypothetical protein